jgi:hypothetical protein
MLLLIVAKGTLGPADYDWTSFENALNLPYGLFINYGLVAYGVGLEDSVLVKRGALTVKARGASRGC